MEKIDKDGTFVSCDIQCIHAYQLIQCVILLPWSSLTTYPQTNTKALKQYTGLSGPGYSLTGPSGTQKYALPSAAVLQVRLTCIYNLYLSVSFSLGCEPLLLVISPKEIGIDFVCRSKMNLIGRKKKMFKLNLFLCKRSKTSLIINHCLCFTQSLIWEILLLVFLDRVPVCCRAGDRDCKRKWFRVDTDHYNRQTYHINLCFSVVTFLKMIQSILHTFKCTLSLQNVNILHLTWGGGVLLIRAYTGGSAQKYLFFRLRVYKRVGISQV